MNSKIIKAFIGLIAAFILVIAVFGILPQLGMKGPFENFQNPWPACSRAAKTPRPMRPLTCRA